MFGRLALLLIALPFVEMALLLVLADLTSWRIALAFIVVTGIAGAWLLRSQGLRTWQRIRAETTAGRLPTDALWDAGMLLAAGALLLTPGVLTDLVGITLLLPPMRRLYRRWLVRWFRSHTRFVGPEAASPHSEVIDSYVVKRHDD